MLILGHVDLGKSLFNKLNLLMNVCLEKAGMSEDTSDSVRCTFEALENAKKMTGSYAIELEGFYNSTIMKDILSYQAKRAQYKVWLLFWLFILERF